MIHEVADANDSKFNLKNGLLYTSDKGELTPPHNPGFIERLKFALYNCGLAGWGEKTNTAKLADFTIGGTRKLFDGDRPPTDLYRFYTLANNLYDKTPEGRLEVKDRRLFAAFLLFGEPNPFSEEYQPQRLQLRHALTETRRSPQHGNIFDTAYEDPLYTSDLLTEVAQGLERKGINTKTYPREKTKRVFDTVVAYRFSEGKPNVKSKEVQDMISFLAKLSKKNLF